MSFTDRARHFALAKAKELEREARTIGITRSVEATEASRWLKDIATAIREACEEPKDKESTT